MNKRIKLSNAEERVFYLFRLKKGKAISHTEITEYVSGATIDEYQAQCYSRPLIHRLRKKLKQVYPHLGNVIKGIRGYGYIYKGPKNI